DHTVWAGLPRTLCDLAQGPGVEPMAKALRDAHDQIKAAQAAFPSFAKVADHAAMAIAHLQKAEAACTEPSAHNLRTRVQAKLGQLGHVLRLSLGVEARARTGAAFIEAGSQTALTLESAPGAAQDMRARLSLPQGWTQDGDVLHVAPDAAPTAPYRPAYDPAAPDAPRLDIELVHEGAQITVPLAFEVEPVVLPPARITLSPSKALLNTKAANRTLMLGVSDLSPASAGVELDVPEGWHVAPTQTGFAVTAPRDVATGLYSIAARVNGAPAQSVRLIQHDHVAPTALARPAVATVGVFDVAVPESKVGYIGAGNDRVGHWLAEMGADVTPLSDTDLTREAALSQFDAIVVGIFAMRFRPGLRAAVPALHRWTDAGGTLVTLYHRPWDNWDPDSTPPRRLEIGQPSLRWRVTDEAADVTQMCDNPILLGPNPITAADWDGWVKERGLYFAKSWDPAYTALLSLSDTGEAPLHGALLVADIGRGRHIHTSLILHHQMEHLVPGAFRLMANFTAKRR
ncbi:MAG: PIG-L family deacetylase, partial [Pseudomonadota bacterium]